MAAAAAEHPVIARGLAPLLLYAPPSLLLVYISEDGVQDIFNPHLPAGFQEFIATQGLWIFVGSALLIALYRLIPLLARDLVNAHNNLGVENALVLMQSIESIVRMKADRFGNEAANWLNASSKTTRFGKAFTVLAKPDQQIYYITQAIWGYFDNISTDVEFEVRLVEVTENHLSCWYVHAPRESPPTEPVSVFDHPASPYRSCLTKRQMVIVSDVQKTASKQGQFDYGSGISDAQGSLLCSPIYHQHTDTYPYVLSIRSYKPGYFMDTRKGYYKWLLHQFTLRIELEHSLRLIKGD